MKTVFALIALSAVTAASAQGLYTTQGADVYKVNPNTVTLSFVGNTGMGNYRYESMTYHPGVGLVAIGFDAATGENMVMDTIDPYTGVGLNRVNLGHGPTVGYWETIEYVSGFGLVVSKGTVDPLYSSQIGIMSLAGSYSPISDNTLDNDEGAWDSTNDRFYFWDPNAVGQFAETNLPTGVFTNRGAIPNTMGDGAWDPVAGKFYAVGVSNLRTLFDVSVIANVANSNNLGTFAGNGDLDGMAYVPVPEPASLIVMGLGGAFLAKAARRRRKS